MSIKTAWDLQSEIFSEIGKYPNTNIEFPSYQMPRIGSIVLESGCGGGIMMDYFSQHGSKVIGIDISIEMLKKCRVKGGQVVLADVRNVPFKDNSFDYVSSLGVIEHFPESRIAFKESIRILKNKGTLSLTIPNRYSFFILLRYFAQKLGSYSQKYSQHFSVSDIENWCNEENVRIEDKQIWRFAPSGLSGFKKIMMVTANFLDNIICKIYNKFGNFLCFRILKDKP